MMDKSVSTTIYNMRFPLIIMVVMLHTFIIDEPLLGIVYVPFGKYPDFDAFIYALKSCFGEVAIPLFFVISGYLFFITINDLTFDEYKQKIRKRITSLLVPYLCWNSLFILFIFFIQLILPEWTSEKKLVLNFGLQDWIDAYWTLNNGLIPLWYVRDLIILSLLSPIIYYIIKKTGFLLPFILGVLYLSNIYLFKYIPGIGTRSSFMFALGSYFGIKRNNFFAWSNSHFWTITISYIIIVLIDTWTWHQDYGIIWLNQFTLILGVLAISALAYRITVKYEIKMPGWLVEASFFIFVFHMFIIYIPTKFWPAILPVTHITIYLMQILIPIIVSLACVGIYRICKRVVPKTTSVLVGSR